MRWFEQLHSANWSQAGWVVLLAYALGCFTTGYYLVRARLGMDVREVGSGAVGAKNVRRVLGWTGFAITTLGDFGKGALAVWAARHFTLNDHMTILAMLAVVAGHIWPVQLWFRGGKGAATCLGALVVCDFRLALVFALCFVVALALMRRTVIPAMFAFTTLPLAAGYLQPEPSRIVLISILSGLVLVAHRKNLLEEIMNLVHEHKHIEPNHEQPKS